MQIGQDMNKKKMIDTTHLDHKILNVSVTASAQTTIDAHRCLDRKIIPEMLRNIADSFEDDLNNGGEHFVN